MTNNTGRSLSYYYMGDDTEGFLRITVGKIGESGEWEFYTTGSGPLNEMHVDEPHNLEFTILCNTEDNNEASWLEWSLIQAYLLRKLPTGDAMCINLMLPKLFTKGLEKAMASTETTLHGIMADLP